MAELKPWRTEGQQARAEMNHGGYILKIKYRVSQTHRSSSQLKTFMSTDDKWEQSGLPKRWPTHVDAMAQYVPCRRDDRRRIER